MGGLAWGTVALLGLAMLVLPPAAAQLDDPPPITLVVTPVEEPVKPLGPGVTLPWQVEATCRALLPAMARDPTANSQPVGVAVGSAPPWLTATVSPATVFLDTGPCQTDPLGTAGANGFLLVTADVSGEAFRAAALGLVADGGDVGTANATVDVVPGFFGQIQATTPTSTFKVNPGESIVASIEVTNNGNAPVTVTFSLKEDPATVRVTLPQSADLAFGQPSPPSITKNVLFEASSAGDLYVNRVDAVTIVVSSAYALDPTLEGDSTIVAFLITTKGIPRASGDSLGPLVGLLAFVGVGVLVGVRRLRRR